MADKYLVALERDVRGNWRLAKPGDGRPAWCVDSPGEAAVFRLRFKGDERIRIKSVAGKRFYELVYPPRTKLKAIQGGLFDEAD